MLGVDSLKNKKVLIIIISLVIIVLIIFSGYIVYSKYVLNNGEYATKIYEKYKNDVDTAALEFKDSTYFKISKMIFFIS